MEGDLAKECPSALSRLGRDLSTGTQAKAFLRRSGVIESWEASEIATVPVGVDILPTAP